MIEFMFIAALLCSRCEVFECDLNGRVQYSKVILISQTEAIAVVSTPDSRDIIYSVILKNKELNSIKIFEGFDSEGPPARPCFVSDSNRKRFVFLSRKSRMVLIENDKMGFKVVTNKKMDKPSSTIAFSPNPDQLVFGFSKYQKETDNYLNEIRLVKLPDFGILDEKEFVEKGCYIDMRFFNNLFVIFYSGRILIFDMGNAFNFKTIFANRLFFFNFHGPLPEELYQALIFQNSYFGLPNSGVFGYYFSYVDFRNPKRLSWRWIRISSHKGSEFLRLIYADRDFHLESRIDSKKKVGVLIIAKNSGEVVNLIGPKTNGKSSHDLSSIDRLDNDFASISQSFGESPSKLIWIKTVGIP